MKAGVKKILEAGIILFIAGVCLIYPVRVLIINPAGYMHGQVFYNIGYANMLKEIFIWFLIALAGVKKRNALWIVGVGWIFSYLHMMLLPMVVAFVYIVLTILMGYFVNTRVFHDVGEGSLFLNFFIGVILLTISYAILSLVDLGSIKSIRIFDGILLLGFIIVYVRTTSISVICRRMGELRRRCVVSSCKNYVKLCMIMSFILLAIGRANESIDYDSQWYGLRSAFVLDNGVGGIFEDLKLVGTVYIYPKGQEIYMLPLAGVKSYGYIYAGNIVLSFLIIFLSYKIGRLFLSESASIVCALMISSVPGIMNMSITAKSDIMTLLMQLTMIYFALLYYKKKGSVEMGAILSLYIYTQTLKPTAVIFSTTILLAVFFICIVYRIRPRFEKRGLGLMIFACIDLAFIWYRTYKLTGIPATSIWGSLFRSLGMTDKYPYASGQISQFQVRSWCSTDVIRTTIENIKQFLLAPSSGQMDHVIIAWGTTLCTFFVIYVVMRWIFNIRKEIKEVKRDAARGFVLLLFIGEFIGALLSFWILIKPDGNYFMLYYSVAVIVGMIYVVEHMVVEPWYYKKGMGCLLVLFLILNTFITGGMTWAWVSSFQNIAWVNKGYYDHYQLTKARMSEMGCNEIFDIMVADPTNRVLAYGIHPNVEAVPCVIESDLDVRHWGNVQLMDSPENYLKFVQCVQYDYIYIEPDYLQKGNADYENICTLIRNDMVSDIIIEGSNVLLKIGEPESGETSKILEMKFASCFL